MAGFMRNAFEYLVLVFVGGSLSVGCVLPSDPPPAQTLGPVLEATGHIPVANLQDKPAPKAEPTEKEKEAAEEARIEKRIRATAHYAAGVAHRERGETEESLEEFYQAAITDPSNEKVVMEVIQMLLIAKQQHKVFKLLIKATEDKDAPANLHALLAASYLERKNYRLARVSAENAIRKGPQQIVGYKSLIQVHRAEIQDEKKRNQAIRKVLNQALKQKDVKTPFKIELAVTLQAFLLLDASAGKELKPKISKLLDDAWETKPENPLLLEALSRGYQSSGSHDKAAEVMDLLLKKLPNNPLVLLQAARGHALAGKLDQAKIHIDALLKKFPRNWQGHQLRAAIAMDQDEYPLATKHYREAIRLNPRVEQLYYDLVSALLSDDKPAEAGRELQEAVDRFEPNFLQSYFGAMIHLQQDRYAEAHTELLKAEEVAKKEDPERLTHFFYFQLGSTAEQAKNYKAAEKYLRQSIKLKEDYATALNYLGYMWADRNENLDEAKKFIARALKEDPDNAAYLDSMAWVFFRKGDVKEALRWQLKALKNSKEDDPELLMHLGQMYEATGDKKKAREYLTKASAIKDVRADIKAKIEAKLKALDE